MAEIENSLGQNLGGGSGIWGTITGDILEQTDLINYLDLNFYPLVGNPSNFLVAADLPGLQNLESVLIEGNESITKDMRFSKSATEYLYIDRFAQEIQFWNTASLPSSALTFLKPQGLYVSNGSTTSTTITSADILLQSTFNNTMFYYNKMNINGVDYTYPNTATSRIATLLDIPDLSGYVPYIGATTSLNLGNYSLEVADVAGNYMSVYGSGFFLGGSLGEFIQLDPVNGLSITDGLGSLISLGYGSLGLSGSLNLNNANITYPAGIGESFSLPTKGVPDTFAMLSDIPADQDLQSVTDINNETTNTLVTKSTGILGSSYRATLSKDGLYINQGSNYTKLFNATLFQNSELEFNSGDGRSVTLGIENAGSFRVTDFKLPTKATGTYILATTSDIAASTWGSITGTLTDQTDLVAALATKEDLVNKTDVMVGNTTSSIKYLSTKGTFDWVNNWWTDTKTLAQTLSGIWTWTNGNIFSPLTNPTYAKGLVFYDNSTESLAYYDDISGTTNNINYEQTLRARNNTGATITNGSVVYISGALGQNPTIALARADSITTCEVIGMVTHDIPNNTVGKVTTFGLVNDLNTSAFADGAIIYLSASTAGLITSTVPTNPNFNVTVGIVAHSHVTQGKVFIHPASPVSLKTSLGTSSLFSVSEKVVSDNLTLKADKLTSAYSKKLNKTNATADEVEVPYRSDGFQTYTDTVTATGTLNGTPTTSYKWRQDDDCVEFWFNGDWSLAGATITQIQIPMPSDLPDPVVPSGFNGASVLLYVGNGHAALNLTNTGASASDMFSSLRRNAANTDYEFTINCASGNYKTFRMYIKYPIS